MQLPKKGNDYLEIDTKELLQWLDISAINEELLTLPGADRLSGEDWKEICELACIACDSYLARDLQEFYEIECEKPYGEGRAFLDIVARCKGTIEPFKTFKDSLVIIDWKTTNSPVDNDAWRTRCLRSYQWREYKFRESAATLFIYRGLSRSIDWRKKGEEGEPAKRSREVILNLPESLVPDVAHRIAGIDVMRESLKEWEVWPKNTQSCDDFGYVCPFLKDCENNTMPQRTIELREMSYSRREMFLRCPERYRRMEIERLEEKDEDNTNVGKMVHAALERIWRKAFEKIKEN